MTALINAALVWDGLHAPNIPSQLMPPGGVDQIVAARQFIGTPHEQLCEIAGRSCYDSFGKGRTSDGFHTHILEVGHLSVLEHGVFTVDFALRRPDYGYALATHFLNRPAVFVRQIMPYTLQVTLNLRHVLEWEQQTTTSFLADPETSAALGPALRALAASIAPQIVRVVPDANPGVEDFRLRINTNPSDENQQWVSLLLTGSRGMSHEQVRHGDWSAISQRSTRYVDESESPWVEHPLITAYRQDKGLPEQAQDLIALAKDTYVSAVNQLEPWLISRGVDKVTARKQARGAARGYLGNALYTEIVFSASVAQWKRMLRARFSGAADAEIRGVYDPVLAALRRTRYASAFEGFGAAPSPDGIGQVLDEKKG